MSLSASVASNVLLRHFTSFPLIVDIFSPAKLLLCFSHFQTSRRLSVSFILVHLFILSNSSKVHIQCLFCWHCQSVLRREAVVSNGPLLDLTTLLQTGLPTRSNMFYYCNTVDKFQCYLLALISQSLLTCGLWTNKHSQDLTKTLPSHLIFLFFSFYTFLM